MPAKQKHFLPLLLPPPTFLFSFWERHPPITTGHPGRWAQRKECYPVGPKGAPKSSRMRQDRVNLRRQIQALKRRKKERKVHEIHRSSSTSIFTKAKQEPRVDV